MLYVLSIIILLYTRIKNFIFGKKHKVYSLQKVNNREFLSLFLTEELDIYNYIALALINNGEAIGEKMYKIEDGTKEIGIYYNFKKEAGSILITTLPNNKNLYNPFCDNHIDDSVSDMSDRSFAIMD